MDSYPIPAKTQESQLEIKRSRFITTIGKADDKPQAKLFIKQRQDEMPDANHHCWAMVAGSPTDTSLQDQSDDGEPRGTAGKPMLNVLCHSGFGNIVVVVSRYFGGVKLGSGGLVRAYTQSVTEALSTLKTGVTYIRTEVEIELPYAAFNSLEHWMRNTNIIVTDKQFQDSIIIKLQVPLTDADPLKQEVRRLGGLVTTRT